MSHFSLCVRGRHHLTRNDRLSLEIGGTRRAEIHSLEIRDTRMVCLFVLGVVFGCVFGVVVVFFGEPGVERG